MQIKRTTIIAMAVLFCAAGAAQAQLVVPLSGYQTWDGLGDPDNTVTNNSVSPDLYINGIAWTGADGATIGASWGSEASIQIANTSQTDAVSLAIFASQGGTCNPCGPATGSGKVTLYPTIFPVSIPDGNVRLEWFESYVDVSNSPSFNFTAGTLSFTTVVPVELMSFSVN